MSNMDSKAIVKQEKPIWQPKPWEALGRSTPVHHTHSGLTQWMLGYNHLVLPDSG